MNYTFQFGVALATLPQLLQGAIVTFELGLLTFWGGALIGLLGASLKTFGGPWLRGLANAYVIFFTNTPALIQIYFLYFGLPEFGIRWDNFTCVLIGLTLNAGAYLTEIMRAGFISVHRTEMEEPAVRAQLELLKASQDVVTWTGGDALAGTLQHAGDLGFTVERQDGQEMVVVAESKAKGVQGDFLVRHIAKFEGIVRDLNALTGPAVPAPAAIPAQ